MKKMINETHIEGLLYDHKLTKKVSGETAKTPGVEFINGTVDIATDNARLNVVTVHFSYVTATTSKGKANATFSALEAIINDNKSIINVGVDEAIKVRVDSAIGLNEFYSDRNGKEELVSVKRNEGGFLHIVTDALNEDEKERSKWKADMLITKVREVEADEEKNLPAKVILSGYVFDFRNALLPVEFVARSAGAMNYFLSLECSSTAPCFLRVWGRQLSQTIVTTTTEESAFDEPAVNTARSTVREFIVTGASKEPYVWDDESTITAMELSDALAAREVTKAEIKKRQDEYTASRAKSGKLPETASKDGDYNF